MTHPLRMRICLPAIATAIAAVLLLPGAASAAAVVPGQVIVGYQPGASGADRADARDNAGTKPIEGLGMANAQLLRVTDGDSVGATVRQLESQPGVAYAAPNAIFQPASIPNEAMTGAFDQQWALNNTGQTVNGVTGVAGADINAPEAWDINTGSSSTVIAVMDTGADLQHPDLQNELWTHGEIPGNGIDDDHNGYVDDVNGYDFYGGDGDPTDLSGHGTHVSGIAAAEGDNGIGTSGVSQHAALMELRVCGTYSNGCPVGDMIEAMNYAGNNGARVLNGSLVGGTFNQAMRQAAESHPNTLYVFAAGNGDSNGNGFNVDSSPTYPCAIDQPVSGQPAYTQNNVICVAATNQFDGRAGFSNFGASSVDLGAPGVNILSTSSRTTFPFDDFETNDFATKWQNDAGNTSDWQRSNESGSFAITDSPGGPYAPNTDSTVTSSPISLDGYSTCELDYFRSIQLGSGDQFTITVWLDKNGNGAIDSNEPSVSPNPPFSGQTNTTGSRSLTLTPGFDQGGPVRVQLQLTSDGANQADGVHMDDLKFVCHGSPSDNGTEFLSGTSMATPMVAGAAGLLFSQAPASTPADVKSELLNSVDQVSALTNATVSGGRLDVFRALQGDFNPAAGGGSGSSGGGSGSAGPVSTRKPNTFFKRRPGRVVRSAATRARVVFGFGADQAGSNFRCDLDSGGYTPCSKRFVRRLGPGRHVLKVRAVNSSGNEDSTAAVAKFRVKQMGA